MDGVKAQWEAIERVLRGADGPRHGPWRWPLRSRVRLGETPLHLLGVMHGVDWGSTSPYRYFFVALYGHGSNPDRQLPDGLLVDCQCEVQAGVLLESDEGATRSVELLKLWDGGQVERTDFREEYPDLITAA